MSSPEQAGGCDRVVEPVQPALPRRPPTRRRPRSLGVAAAVPRTRRQCANGPAPMDIRSAIEVESPVTFWKPSAPAHRRRQPQPRSDDAEVCTVPSACPRTAGRPRWSATYSRRRCRSRAAGMTSSGPKGPASRSPADRALFGAWRRSRPITPRTGQARSRVSFGTHDPPGEGGPQRHYVRVDEVTTRRRLPGLRPGTSTHNADSGQRAQAKVDHHDLESRGWVPHRRAQGGVHLEPHHDNRSLGACGEIGHPAPVKYVRIFADEQGLSHFEDVELDLKRQHVTDGVPPVQLAGAARRVGRPVRRANRRAGRRCPLATARDTVPTMDRRP
jgi:hypothetical protein